MGAVIQYLEIQPFIVTLAGMFLARGLCYVISVESIPIRDPLFTTIAQTAIPLPGDTFVSPSVVVALARRRRRRVRAALARGSAAPSTPWAATRTRPC